MRFKFTIFVISALMALTGCVSAPPGPTKVDLAATGTANMNKGAPVKVKIYYLASTSKFQTSDFFALFNSPEATLGADLLAIDDLLLSPGGTVTKSRSLPVAPAAVGVVAAFRDIDSSKFSAVRSVASNKSNSLQMVVSGNSVSLR